MARIPLSADSPDEPDGMTEIETKAYIGENFVGVDTLMRLNGNLRGHGAGTYALSRLAMGRAALAKKRAARRTHPALPDSAAATAEFLARGGQITKCPPAAAEAVNSGDGFDR